MTLRITLILLPFLCLVAIAAAQDAGAEPPVIKRYIGPQEIWKEESLIIDLEDYDGGSIFEDPDGGNLTYGFHSDGVILVTIAGSIITFTGAPDFVGSESGLLIWAVDEQGERSENMTLFFTVSNGHGPHPEVSSHEPGWRTETVYERVPVIFRVLNITMYPLDLWTFAWYVNGRALEGFNTTTLHFPDNVTDADAYNTSGVYGIRVEPWYFEGEYGIGASDYPVWTLTVLDANRPPVVEMVTEDQKVSQGDRRYLQVRAFDPDGDDLAYVWYLAREAGPPAIVGKGDRVLFEGDLGPGDHYFWCDVSDGNLTTSSDPVTFTNEPDHESPFGASEGLVLFIFTVIAFVARRLDDQRNAY